MSSPGQMEKMVMGKAFGSGPSGEASTSAVLSLGAILILRKKWLMWIWVLSAILFTAIAFLLPKKYTTEATFQVNTQSSMKFGLPEGLKMLDPKFNSSSSGTGAVLAILDSRKMAMEMINAFHLKAQYRTKWDHLAIKQFRKNFEYQIFDEGIIQVSFTHDSPDTAKIILDSIVNYLNRESIAFSTSKAKLEFEFNKSLVDSVLHHLDSLSEVWIDFMKRNKMVDFEKNVELSLKSYGKVEESLVDLEGEYALAKIDNSKSPQDRQNIKTMIELLRGKRDEILKGRNSLKQKNQSFELAMNYDSIPSMSAYIEKLNLYVEKDKIVLRALLPKLEDSRIKTVETVPILNMLDPTYVPPYKSGPKRILIILIGTLLAGCFGTVVLVLRDVFLNPLFRPRNLDNLIMHVRQFN